jgi:hypothetical protein
MARYYVIGDATAPQGDGPRVIVHVCNDVGKWGKGLVLALSGRWPEAEGRYRARYQGEESTPFALGGVKDILTSAPHHTRGIKVRLEDGQIGRVQEIEPAEGAAG